MKKIFFIWVLLMPLFVMAQAQDSTIAEGETNSLESHFDATLELTTKYMWRGIEYGTAPVTFASINYSIGGLNACALGGYTIDGSQQEAALGLSYSYRFLTIGFADVYYPSLIEEKDDYFVFWTS